MIWVMFGDIATQIQAIITLYLYDIQCPLCGFYTVISFLAFRQTSQLLVVHFDTTVSICGDVSVKSETLSEDSERLETDGAISSFIFMLMLLSLIF